MQDNEGQMSKGAKTTQNKAETDKVLAQETSKVFCIYAKSVLLQFGSKSTRFPAKTAAIAPEKLPPASLRIEMQLLASRGCWCCSP